MTMVLFVTGDLLGRVLVLEIALDACIETCVVMLRKEKEIDESCSPTFIYLMM